MPLTGTALRRAVAVRAMNSIPPSGLTLRRTRAASGKMSPISMPAFANGCVFPSLRTRAMIELSPLRN